MRNYLKDFELKIPVPGLYYLGPGITGGIGALEGVQKEIKKMRIY